MVRPVGGRKGWQKEVGSGMRGEGGEWLRVGGGVVRPVGGR